MSEVAKQKKELGASSSVGLCREQNDKRANDASSRKRMSFASS